MGRFEKLLEVQEHDSAIDRLQVRREGLPERAQLVDAESRAARLEERLGELREKREDAVREEKRFDDTVAAVEEKMGQVEADLYSGATSSPRELQAFQAELEQLRRQRSALEDQELDVMERREELEAEIGGLEAELADVNREIAELRERIATDERQIDASIAAERSAREAAAAEVPDDLVELYEQIRSKSGGVATAKLVGGTCQACHLALPAVEVDRIKREPPDALVRCDQCGAILVRG